MKYRNDNNEEFDEVMQLLADNEINLNSLVEADTKTRPEKVEEIYGYHEAEVVNSPMSIADVLTAVNVGEILKMILVNILNVKCA